MNGSFLAIMNHGGGSMWVIALFSIIALGVALERAWAHWQFVARAKELADKVNGALSQETLDDARSSCERALSPLADVFLVGLKKTGKHTSEVVGAATHRERQRVASRLKSNLWMLGTIGATAPFVGLFGTVVGIMDAMGKFKADEAVKFSMVSGPISEALVVTAAGILVAVEAVVLFNYFSQRAAAIGTELRHLTDEFLEHLGEHGARKASS